MSLSRTELLEFLRDDLRVDTGKIDDETALFSSRMIDSFSMVDLILFLETRGGFKMKPTEVHLDNLDSVARIMRFYESQIGGENGPGKDGQ